MTGKLFDWEYTLMEVRKGGDFTIEYARLRLMAVYLTLFIGGVIACGWCLQFNSSIAVPLVLAEFLGWTSIGILNAILQTRSSGATDCTNLVRCSLAAILVSMIERMTNALGLGWTYTFWGGTCTLLLPLMFLEMKICPKWQRNRDRKE